MLHSHLNTSISCSAILTLQFHVQPCVLHQLTTCLLNIVFLSCLLHNLICVSPCEHTPNMHTLAFFLLEWPVHSWHTLYFTWHQRSFIHEHTWSFITMWLFKGIHLPYVGMQRSFISKYGHTNISIPSFSIYGHKVVWCLCKWHFVLSTQDASILKTPSPHPGSPTFLLYLFPRPLSFCAILITVKITQQFGKTSL